MRITNLPQLALVHCSLVQSCCYMKSCKQLLLQPIERLATLYPLPEVTLLWKSVTWPFFVTSNHSGGPLSDFSVPPLPLTGCSPFCHAPSHHWGTEYDARALWIVHFRQAHEQEIHIYWKVCCNIRYYSIQLLVVHIFQEPRDIQYTNSHFDPDVQSFNFNLNEVVQSSPIISISRACTNTTKEKAPSIFCPRNWAN